MEVVIKNPHYFLNCKEFMKKKFLISILQHRNVYFAITAFFHLHAALKDRPDLRRLVKIVFACTGRKLIALEEIKRQYGNLYDIDIFECEGDYLIKVNAIFSAYPQSEYPYFIKHDEDIFVSPQSWTRLLESAEQCLSDSENLLLSVNLSTGIPSWSQFASVFFSIKELKRIYANLALSQVPNELWGNDYTALQRNIDSVDEWDENSYWDWVNDLGYDYRGIHPIRLEIGYPLIINQLIINDYQKFLDASVSTEIYKISNRYFCNSFFCMPYERYQTVVQDKSLFVDLFDEVPINRYARIHKANFCFLENSLAIHIIYNSVYEQDTILENGICNGRKLEQYFLRRYFNLITQHLNVDPNNYRVFPRWAEPFHHARLRLKKKVHQAALKIYQKHYRP